MFNHFKKQTEFLKKEDNLDSGSKTDRPKYAYAFSNDIVIQSLPILDDNSITNYIFSENLAESFGQGLNQEQS